jgi:PAS domain S-box-containing protein
MPKKSGNKKLQRADNQFRNIFDYLGDMIFIIDFDGKIVEVNETVVSTLGYPRSKLIGMTPAKISVTRAGNADDSIHSPFEEYDQLIQSEQLLFGAELRAFDGSSIPIEAKTRIIEFEGREAIFSIVRNVTDRVNLEKKILSIIMETEEKERRRVSEELHDGLGPLLSSVKMYINLLLQSQNPEQNKEILGQVKELVSESLSSIREISQNLMPQVLYDYGLISAIKTLIKRISNIEVLEISLDTDNWKQRVDKGIEVLLYRVLSELITNTLKHSGATKVKIIFHQEENRVKVHYSDNGNGFSLKEKLAINKGMGLTNIINRIRSIHGKIAIRTSSGRGLKVSISLDL